MLEPLEDGKSPDRDYVVHQDLIEGVKLKVLANVSDHRGTVREI